MVFRPSFLVLFLCAVWVVPRCGARDCSCPPFWTAWHDHCYRYFGEEVQWTEAVNNCRLFGAPGESTGIADLVSIHSKEEHDFLYSWWRSLRHADNRHGHPGLWIGLTDYEENSVYKWSDGTDVDYENFDVRQETATEYRWGLWDWTDSNWNPQGKWHDFADNDKNFQYICKMEQQ